MIAPQGPHAMKIHVSNPADPDRIDLLMHIHQYRIDTRGPYPTLIRGLQTWKVNDYESGRKLAMKLIYGVDSEGGESLNSDQK
jgi:hypothetical protein